MVNILKPGRELEQISDGWWYNSVAYTVVTVQSYWGLCLPLRVSVLPEPISVPHITEPSPPLPPLQLPPSPSPLLTLAHY